jgi:hypothetical protein
MRNSGDASPTAMAMNGNGAPRHRWRGRRRPAATASASTARTAEPEQRPPQRRTTTARAASTATIVMIVASAGSTVPRAASAVPGRLCAAPRCAAFRYPGRPGRAAVDRCSRAVQGERRFERRRGPERAPRPERRPRREREVEADAGDDVAAALPSFLTTPVRVRIGRREPEEPRAPNCSRFVRPSEDGRRGRSEAPRAAGARRARSWTRSARRPMAVTE